VKTCFIDSSKRQSATLGNSQQPYSRTSRKSSRENYPFACARVRYLHPIRDVGCDPGCDGPIRQFIDGFQQRRHKVRLRRPTRLAISASSTSSLLTAGSALTLLRTGVPPTTKHAQATGVTDGVVKICAHPRERDRKRRSVRRHPHNLSLQGTRPPMAEEGQVP